MGWVFGIGLTVVGLVKNDSGMIIAASLFALTGAVSAIVVAINSIAGDKN